MSEATLPSGWLKSKLSQVIQPRGEKFSPVGCDHLQFIGMDHVEAQTTKIIGTVSAGSMKSSAARFYAGDILYGRLRPYLNKVAQPNFDGLASAEFIVFPDTILVHSKFLKFRLNAADFVSFASHLNEGDRPRVSFDQIGDFEISVPPPLEQHRIVAKIEELFSELDKGIENLKTARAQLKVYRQALLKHAFEGKLTAQWRVEKQDQLETADALLKRIQQERTQLYQQQLADWENSKSPSVPLLQRGKTSSAATSSTPPLKKGGRGDLKPKAPKPLLPLTAEELAELPELPEGWGWFAMGDICQESILGKMLDKEKNKGQLKPYLRNINVRWGKFDLEDLLEMRFEDSEFLRYGLEDGDLVVCEGGEPGRCAVWRKEFGLDMQIQKALHRIRFTNSMNSSFVQLYFELCSSNRRLEKMFTGTTIKHLTGEKLTRMAIPICSIAEQTQILLALESKFSEVDQLDQTLTTSLQQAEALRQSILKKAFSGQLVPQDPHDEPASMLLARIKAERATAKDNLAVRLKGRTAGKSNMQKMHIANFSYPEIPDSCRKR